MSAPDVNIETQKHRHRTMIRGLWIGAAFAALVVIVAGIVILGFGVSADGILPAQTEAAAA